MVAINPYAPERNGEAHAEPIVELKNVSRRFGDKLALDNIMFRVPAGSVVGLVG
jgi:ABC-type sugar transport system ATPase subunit